MLLSVTLCCIMWQYQKAKAKAVNMNEYILKLIVGHAIDDITEKTYTHRTIEDLHREIQKNKKVSPTLQLPFPSLLRG